MTVTLAFKAFAKAIPSLTPCLATSDPSVLKRILAYISGLPCSLNIFPIARTGTLSQLNSGRTVVSPVVLTGYLGARDMAQARGLYFRISWRRAKQYSRYRS